MISAHWYTRGLFVTEAEYPKTIHDFYGFPKKLYEIEYGARNCSEYRDRVDSVLGIDSEISGDWGYDHGNYSILHYMYPNRDIPVLQVSVNGLESSEYHYRMGKRLKILRDEGYLIVGSGNIVHNLSKYREDDKPYDWAMRFDKKVKTLVEDKNIEAILKLEKEDGDFKNAVPSGDHYYPFLMALGASDEKDSVTVFNDEVTARSLSMTSYIWE